MDSSTSPGTDNEIHLNHLDGDVLPYGTVDDCDLDDIWWTRWSLLAPYWQGYTRTMLQSNFLKGHLLKGLRVGPRSPPSISGTLEQFLHLPTELVFEVFQHLHALDLYHMSRASKALARALLGPKAHLIWRQAFARIPEFPPCPPALKEPEWAYLIFGPVQCQDCGRSGAQPDVALYKHFCSPCTDKHFVSKKEILDMFSSHPDPKKIYSKLRTVCQSRCRLVTLQPRLRLNERRSEKRFLREDVELSLPYIMKELDIENAEEADGNSTSDSPVTNDDPRVWRVARAEKIALTNDHTLLTLRWVVSVLTDLQEEHRRCVIKCLDRCKKRISNMKLGYSLEDIRGAVESDWKIYFQAMQIQKMTRRDFQSHKSFLINTVRNRAKSRLKADRRMEILKLCEEFRANLSAREIQHHPPTAQLMDEAVFQEYINQNIDYPTTYSPSLAQENLPKLSREWTESLRDDLAFIWIQSGVGAGLTAEAAKKQLDLAQCVFLCTRCKTLDQRWNLGPALCGWDNALKHTCHIASDKHQVLEVSQWGIDIVVSMLRRLGLDPETTTSKEMDEMDLRLICEGCSVLPRRKGVCGKEVYTWSEFVTHVIQYDQFDPDHFGSASALGTEATRFVKDHERKVTTSSMDPWGCAHCPAHLEDSVTVTKAIAHVKKAHKIEDVILQTDVIQFKNRYPAESYKPRKPFIFSFAPFHNMKCNHCPTMAVCKLWDKHTLREHLKTKHRIHDPVDSIDWSPVKIIETCDSLTAELVGDRPSHPARVAHSI